MMRKLLLLLVICAVSCAPQVTVKNLDSKGETIICFGDSITAGAGVDTIDSYPSVLSRLIKRGIINAGVGGDTTLAAINRVEKDVIANNPFLVIIELGGNDYLRRMYIEDTVKNLEAIIVKIQSAGAIVALCDISSGFVMGGYRKKFRNLADKTGSIFIAGVLDDILTNPELKTDGIHPNKPGYELMAKRIYEKLKEYFAFE